MTDIKRYYVGDITDTFGAAAHLTERMGHSIGVDSVHKLVRNGKLRAWMFQQGELVVRQPGQTRGKDLIFLKSDLAAITPVKRGNPKIGELNKKS